MARYVGGPLDGHKIVTKEDARSVLVFEDVLDTNRPRRGMEYVWDNALKQRRFIGFVYTKPDQLPKPKVMKHVARLKEEKLGPAIPRMRFPK